MPIHTQLYLKQHRGNMEIAMKKAALLVAVVIGLPALPSHTSNVSTSKFCPLRPPTLCHELRPAQSY